MKLRIVTATRGVSPYWTETAGSVLRAKPGAEYLVIGPEGLRVGASEGLRVLTERQAGFYAALNQALASPGEWDAFTWINDDDVLVAPGFGRVVEAMERSPDVDIAYGLVDLIDRAGAQVGWLPTARTVGDLGAIFARGMIPFAQPATIIRRRAYQKYGPLDENYRIVADMDFFVRAVAGGARFAFVDAHAASFRLQAGQLSKQPEVAAETARALRPLAGAGTSLGSLLRFRLQNWRVYSQRFRRHGWVSMREIYDRTE